MTLGRFQAKVTTRKVMKVEKGLNSEQQYLEPEQNPESNSTRWMMRVGVTEEEPPVDLRNKILDIKMQTHYLWNI
ncbi:hypothetical protein Trydic_g22718 [Trypoxylus dichotomus]